MMQLSLSLSLSLSSLYTAVIYIAIARTSLAVQVFFKPASCRFLRHFICSLIIVPLAKRHNSIWIRKLLDKFFFSNSISKTCFNYLDLLPNVQTFVSGANLLKLLVIVKCKNGSAQIIGSTLAFVAGDHGSNPRRGEIFFTFISEFISRLPFTLEIYHAFSKLN